ncbi:MAG: flagellar export chaperone FlgN [Oceanobacter sp.]
MQPNTRKIVATFHGQLLYELAIGRLLQHCLQQEQADLTSVDAEHLLQSNTRKSVLLTRLSETANRRLNWMSQQNIPLSDELNQHELMRNNPALQTLWQQLAEQYQTNKTLAEQLSELALKLRHRTRKQIDILTGRNQDPLTYNESGTTRNNAGGSGYISA